mgnify:CR=1 FL=1
MQKSSEIYFVFIYFLLSIIAYFLIGHYIFKESFLILFLFSFIGIPTYIFLQSFTFYFIISFFEKLINY